MLGEKEIGLIQDVKTRWNSQFSMLERMLQLKLALNMSIPEMDKLPTSGLTHEEWTMAKDLIDLLAPLEASTRTLCGDTYASASMIIPTIGTAIEYITAFRLISKEILAFRAYLVTRLKDRFLDIEDNDILSIATLLDPRFRDSGIVKFFSKDLVVYIVNLIKHELLRIPKSRQSAGCHSTPNSISKLNQGADEHCRRVVIEYSVECQDISTS